MKLIPLLVTPLLAAPALAQTPAAPTFAWRLNLRPGQTWTQTVTTRGLTRQAVPDPRTNKPTELEINISSVVALRSQVVSVSPTAYLIRATYTRFEQDQEVRSNGQLLPQPKIKPSDLSRALVGASFSFTQAPDGRVLDVTGLEDLVARQKRTLSALFPSAKERAAVESFLPVPTVAQLRESIIKNQSAILPSTPLAVGQSYSYASSVAIPLPVPFQLAGKRTLRSFDATRAVFDDDATFNIAPVQIGGPKPKRGVVLLSGAAAIYYLYQKEKKQNAAKFAQPIQYFLSKNGRIYYRDPQTKQAIWVTPPPDQVQAVALPASEAQAYAQLQGYNNQKTGNGLDYYFSSPGQNSPAPTPAIAAPVVSPTQQKVFVALHGTISGQIVVDAPTGLQLSSALLTEVSGKVTVAHANGRKTSAPMNIRLRSTAFTSMP